MIPVVHTRTQNDHRTTVGFIGGIRKLTGDLFDVTPRHAGDLLAPGRGVGFDFAVIFNGVVILQPAI
ncbi:hypothetical protein D3C76_1340960 [compost metagenome]